MTDVDAERVADAILRAAGSGLHHFSLPYVRAKIVGTTAGALAAAHAQGFEEGRLAVKSEAPK